MVIRPPARSGRRRCACHRQRGAVVDPRGGAAQVRGPHLPRSSRERRQCVRGLAGAELVMHEAVHAAIHLRRVGRLVHRREIARVEPVLLDAELLPDALVELVPGSGYDTDTPMSAGSISRASCSVASMSVHVSPGYPNCRNTPTSMPAAFSSRFARADVLDAQALLHRVEHLLRSRLRAHPQHPAARARERLRDARRHLIGAHQATERHARVAAR